MKLSRKILIGALMAGAFNAFAAINEIDRSHNDLARICRNITKIYLEKGRGESADFAGECKRIVDENRGLTGIRELAQAAEKSCMENAIRTVRSNVGAGTVAKESCVKASSKAEGFIQGVADMAANCQLYSATGDKQIDPPGNGIK